MQLSVSAVNYWVLVLRFQVPSEHKASFMSTLAEQKCAGETLTLC